MKKRSSSLLPQQSAASFDFYLIISISFSTLGTLGALTRERKKRNEISGHKVTPRVPCSGSVPQPTSWDPREEVKGGVSSIRPLHLSRAQLPGPPPERLRCMSAARSSAFGGSEALWPLAAGVAASWRARLAWLGAFQGKRGVSSCRKAEGALVGEPRRLQLRDAASTQRGGCREGIGDRKRKTESNGGRKVGGGR